MKAHFLGTGCLWTSSKCTSFVLDGRILFDVGFGATNSLRENNLEVTDIDTIIISHFHPDHIGDIMYFLLRHWNFAKRGLSKELTIIGPTGTKNVIRKYLNTTLNHDGNNTQPMTPFIENIDKLLNERTTELANGEYFENNKIKVTAFGVIHGSATCNGYILDIDNNKIGCSGDSCLCENLIANIPNADTWFIDSANPKGHNHARHVSLEQVIGLAKQYPNKRFYTIHRHDYDIPTNTPENVFFPQDNNHISI